MPLAGVRRAAAPEEPAEAVSVTGAGLEAGTGAPRRRRRRDRATGMGKKTEMEECRGLNEDGK